MWSSGTTSPVWKRKSRATQSPSFAAGYTCASAIAAFPTNRAIAHAQYSFMFPFPYAARLAAHRSVYRNRPGNHPRQLDVPESSGNHHNAARKRCQHSSYHRLLIRPCDATVAYLSGGSTTWMFEEEVYNMRAAARQLGGCTETAHDARVSSPDLVQRG